jgi:uncharacterized protein
MRKYKITLWKTRPRLYSTNFSYQPHQLIEFPGFPGRLQFIMTSLYDISIIPLTNIVNTMTLILRKGEEHAKANNISEADLLSARIYQDMLPLSNQVLITVMVVRRTIKNVSERTLPDLTGPTSAYEGSLAELFQLLDGAAQDLAAITRESVDGKENQQLTFNVGPRILKKGTAADYVHGYALPYAYFHLNIAYAILRQQGVPLGKLDYVKEFIRQFEDA